jgi:hypothetical protein
MANVANQPQTKVVETLVIGGKGASAVNTAKDIIAKIGRPLGSPINGKEVGDKFQATLTGKIEIREFQGQKGAYFTTKEGYSIRVNASFDPSIHKEGAVMTCVCRELVTDNRSVKFAAFSE